MSQVQTQPLKLAASQAEQLCIETCTITARKGFNALQEAGEHACPLSLRSTANKLSVHGAPGREADLPSRRWIYSTNNSTYHTVFSGELDLLGHTCARNSADTCRIVTHSLHVHRPVQDGHTHTCNYESTHTCTHTQVQALHNGACPSNPKVFVVPRPPRQAEKWRDEGRKKRYSGLNPLIWNQWWFVWNNRLPCLRAVCRYFPAWNEANRFGDKNRWCSVAKSLMDGRPEGGRLNNLQSDLN